MPTALPSPMPPPPSQPIPSYILRGHTSQISVLTFSLDAKLLYSGDVDGWVAVWDLATFRPRFFWKAHEAGVLSVEEWEGGLLTHARDNKLHYFTLPSALASLPLRAAASAVPSPSSPTSPAPLPHWSMDVNAMAYCKMSLLSVPGKQGEALVAVPALTKDELVDVFHLPSLARVHRSIGSHAFAIGDKTGTVMALSLLLSPAPTTTSPSSLHLLAAYEDGRVALFQHTSSIASAFDVPKGPKKEGESWEVAWEEKGHREAVMSLAVSEDRKFAWSVAADHYLCKYSLWSTVKKLSAGEDEQSIEPSHMYQLETDFPGRSAAAVRSDGKLLSVAGWDGELRLYSAKSGAPLAVLSYHRSSLHAVAFAPLPAPDPSVDKTPEEDSDDEEEAVERRAWVATGGKEEKISLWEVYPPERGLTTAQ